MANTALLNNGFRFNLLPPKPKEEVELEVEREDSITYAFILIFVASIIYLGLVVLGSFVTEPRLKTALAAIDTRNQQISTYATAQSLHGELYVKTQTLKPLLDLDLIPSEIFRVANELVANDPTLQIQSYSREKTGAFVFQIVAPKFSDVTKIANKAAVIDGVSSVFIRAAVLNSARTSVTTTIALNIDALNGSANQN